jgi:hypothetical protein
VIDDWAWIVGISYSLLLPAILLLLHLGLTHRKQLTPADGPGSEIITFNATVIKQLFKLQAIKVATSAGY